MTNDKKISDLERRIDCILENLIVLDKHSSQWNKDIELKINLIAEYIGVKFSKPEASLILSAIEKNK